MTDAEPQQTNGAGEPVPPVVPPASPTPPPAPAQERPTAPPPGQWAPPPAQQWAPPPAQQWAPPTPAQPTAPPAYGQPTYAQPTPPPAYGQPTYAQPTYAPPVQPSWAQPAAAWTPPPKPGLIPLRPLSFGTLLGAPYQMLRRNPKATFGSALLIQGIVAVLTAAAFVPILIFFASRLENASETDAEAITAGTVALSVLVGIVVAIVAIVASAFLQGIIVLEAARATLGEKLRLGQLWRLAGRRAVPLTLWLLLYGLAASVAIGVVVVIAVVLYSLGSAALPFAIIWTVIGIIGLVVLGAWIYTKTLLVPCVIVLEGQGIVRSVRRSWMLVRGSFWKVFGVNLLVAFIIFTAANIISAPISFFATMFAGTFTPTNAGDGLVPYLFTQGIGLLVTLIVQSVASVVQSGTVALLYIDMRMRHEGLDLELLRAVEARESGETVPDPFATPAFATA